VPFSVTIAAAPANAGLTPLIPWPGVPGWVTYQGNISHTGFVPVTLDPSRFAYRWVWMTPSQSNNANAAIARLGELCPQTSRPERPSTALALSGQCQLTGVSGAAAAICAKRILPPPSRFAS
jgi:hypothetical protein